MMDPPYDEANSPPVRFVWLLIELKVEGKSDMVPITMPVPIVEGQTLQTMRNAYAWESRMVEARIEALYGAMWLAGRQWSISGDHVIPETVARRMFPDDRFKAGRYIGGRRDPDHG